MIYILSEPVQTGKTSIIEKAIHNTNHIGGFLTPTIDGKRKIKNLHNQELVEFEVLAESKNTIAVGKFIFKDSAFSEATAWTRQHYHNSQIKCIIIDELGKLELKKEGFHELIEELLSYEWNEKNLLLIIRDYLLDEAIKKYKLLDYKVLRKKDITKLLYQSK